jgi:chromosome segregation ATPase
MEAQRDTMHNETLWLQAELKAAHEKATAVAGDLENARRKCKVHELEARDAVARAQQCEGDVKRAQKELDKVSNALNIATAQRTALQQQLHDSQASISVRKLLHSASCIETFITRLIIDASNAVDYCLLYLPGISQII